MLLCTTKTMEIGFYEFNVIHDIPIEAPDMGDSDIETYFEVALR